MNLQPLFDEHLIGFLLISNPLHVQYLTSFPVSLPTEREAWIVLTPQSLHLITDIRYETEAQNATPLNENFRYSHHILNKENPFTKILESIVASERVAHNQLGNNGIRVGHTSNNRAQKDIQMNADLHVENSQKSTEKIRFGFESDNLTFEEYKSISEKVVKVDLEYVPILHPLSAYREIKSEVEVAKIQQASTATVQCFEHIQTWMKIGMTEAEIAFEIEKWLFLEGYSCAFSPIVAFNEHAAQIHFNPKAHGDKKLENGTFVLIDMGAKFETYCSDMSRTFIFGEKSASSHLQEFEKAYDVVEKAYTAGLNTLRECAHKNLYGKMTYADVDRAVRAVFVQHNLEDFAHATGHGVGLDIHEAPRIYSTSTEFIQKGHVVTIEPGFYSQGKFGIRIEDTVLLEEHGIKILTK